MSAFDPYKVMEEKDPTLWDDAFIVSVFNVLMERSHNTAEKHGFWDDPLQNAPGVKLALMHSEISETLEAYRKKEGKERYAEELADLLIRVFDFAYYEELDLGNALLEKMEKNKAREFRHGKEF